MSRSGRLIWRGYAVEWAHEGFRSRQNLNAPLDLTPHPHFTLKASDEATDTTITYDDVVMPVKLRGVDDFTKLPNETMNQCLNELVGTLEREAKR
jgi:hypothetical protein